MSDYQPRRQVVLDRRWQLHVWQVTAKAALASCAIYVLAGILLLQWLPIEEMSGDAIGVLAFAANGVFFVALAGILYFVTMRLTHTVAGPALVLGRAIRGMQRGEFHHRTKLRKGDYLQDLAEDVAELSTHLQEQHSRQDEFHKQLLQALERGDVTVVRELVQAAIGTGKSPVDASKPSVDTSRSPVERPAETGVTS